MMLWSANHSRYGVVYVVDRHVRWRRDHCSRSSVTRVQIVYGANNADAKQWWVLMVSRRFGPKTFRPKSFRPRPKSFRPCDLRCFDPLYYRDFFTFSDSYDDISIVNTTFSSHMSKNVVNWRQRWTEAYGASDVHSVRSSFAPGSSRSIFGFSSCSFNVTVSGNRV